MVLPVASRFADGPLGADATGVGIAIGAFAIGSLAAPPVVGWASDRFGRRPLLIVGALLTVGGARCSTSPSIDAARCSSSRARCSASREAFFFVAVLSRPRATSRRRSGAARRSTSRRWRSTSGSPSGRRSARRSSARRATTAVWIVAARARGRAPRSWQCSCPRRRRPCSAAAAGDVRSARPLIHPAGLFPGVLILLGLWGMAGFLAFVPLYATEIGMAGAGRAAGGVRR